MTRSIPTLLAVPLAWLVVCSVQAQRPALPAGAAGPPVRLQGRVLEADTVSMPLARARVTITPRGGTESAPVFTDASGRFEISVPAATSYTASMAKAGFVRQTRTLTAQDTAAPIELRLVRGGVIAGTVVDASGRPVVAAQVGARRIDTPANTTASLVQTTTDDLGAYRLSGLAPGRYEVQVTRQTVQVLPSVNRAPAGAATAATQPPLRRTAVSRNTAVSAAVTVDVESGDEETAWLVSSETTAAPSDGVHGGAVSGVIRDPFGEPVEGLQVQLWSVRFTNGRLTARREQSRTTDDRGQYRLFHIPTGRYLIAAADNPQRASTPGASSFIPVYYPGRHSSAEATPLDVGRDEQFAGIDLVFTERTGARVSGIVTNAAGQPVPARVSLTVSHRSGSVAMPPLDTSANARGEFELQHVPPGDYVVRTTTPPAVAARGGVVVRRAERAAPSAGAPAFGGNALAWVPVNADDAGEFAVQYVTVHANDPPPVLLQTAPRVSARGRVVFENGPPRGTSLVRVGAVAADPDLTPSTRAAMVRATRADDWAFTLQDVQGPMRLTVADVPPGWWLRTVAIGRATVADAAIDFGQGPAPPGEITLVLANTAAALEGRALDDRGRPANWVIAFPVDTRRWYPGSPYVRNVSTGPDGRYVLESLAPGDYWVAAVDVIGDDSPFAEWQSAEILSRLISASRQVSLRERDRVTTDLRLTRMPRF